MAFYEYSYYYFYYVQKCFSVAISLFSCTSIVDAVVPLLPLHVYCAIIVAMRDGLIDIIITHYYLVIFWMDFMSDQNVVLSERNAWNENYSSSDYFIVGLYMHVMDMLNKPTNKHDVMDEWNIDTPAFIESKSVSIVVPSFRTNEKYYYCHQ